MDFKIRPDGDSQNDSSAFDGDGFSSDTFSSDEENTQLLPSSSDSNEFPSLVLDDDGPGSAETNQWQHPISEINMQKFEFTEPEAEPIESSKGFSFGGTHVGKLVAQIFGFVIVSIAGFIAYDYFVNDVPPEESIDQLLSVFTGEDNYQQPRIDIPKPPNQNRKPNNAVTSDNNPTSNYGSQSGLDIIQDKITLAEGQTRSAEQAMRDKTVNPYWHLPNQKPALERPLERPINPEEEIAWQNALEHQYPYQRLKAILAIREARLADSHGLLWYGVTDKKLWIRMRSIMALADHGYDVSIGHVQKAIGNEPYSRIANFIKRFQKDVTLGELYIMRHMIKIVGEQARLSILKVIEQNLEPHRNAYIAAANFDPGHHIQKWLRNSKAIYSMPYEEYKKYLPIFTLPVGPDDPSAEDSNKLKDDLLSDMDLPDGTSPGSDESIDFGIDDLDLAGEAGGGNQQQNSEGAGFPEPTNEPIGLDDPGTPAPVQNPPGESSGFEFSEESSDFNDLEF